MTTKYLDYNSPFLLVDSSYLIFYRFFALRLWYKKAHKDEVIDEHKWMENPQFMEKYDKLFFEGIKKICKKRKIPLNNIIFSFDARCYNVWRSKLTNNYKSTRKESHTKSKFFCYQIFKHAEEKLIKPYNNGRNITMFHENAEADDINAILSRILSTKTSQNIYIIASDADYIQLCNKKNNLDEPQIQIIDIKNNNIWTKYIKPNFNSNQFLISKILLGDNSDNIPSCNFKTSILVDNNILITKLTSLNVWTKCTKSLVAKILENTNSEIYKLLECVIQKNRKFVKDRNDICAIELENGDKQITDLELDNITEDGYFTKNQIIIDFECIPTNLKNQIIKLFD